MFKPDKVQWINWHSSGQPCPYHMLMRIFLFHCFVFCKSNDKLIIPFAQFVYCLFFYSWPALFAFLKANYYYLTHPFHSKCFFRKWQLSPSKLLLYYLSMCDWLVIHNIFRIDSSCGKYLTRPDSLSIHVDHIVPRYSSHYIQILLYIVNI